jgi:MFS family permease
MSLPSATYPVPDETVPRHEKWVVVCVAFAAFTFQFEAFVISVALPDMAREMASSSTEISFVVITYLLAATITFLPAGRLGERYGLRRIFLSAALLACAGTLLSGISFNLHLLYVSRLITGVGMGALVAVSYAMIPAWINQKRLGWGYGVLSLGAGLGMIAGLPIGGLLSYYLVWQWIFLASTPIFMVLIVVAYHHLPRHKLSGVLTSSQPGLDWIGLLLFSLLLSSLMLVMSLGAEFGWTSRLIVSLMLAILVSACVLLWRAYRGRSLLSPEMFRHAGFFLALLTLFLFQFVSSGIRFLMPFYLELSVGLTVLMSSALMLIYPLSFAPTGVWAGRLADRVGSRLMVLLALGLGAFICALYVSALTQLNIWMFSFFMFGFGVVCALFSPPNNRLIMSTVPNQNRGEASALLPVALNMGSLLGISFFESLFSLRFTQETGQSLEMFATTQGAQQIIIDGFKHAFLFATLIFLLTFVVVFLCKRSYEK